MGACLLLAIGASPVGGATSGNDWPKYLDDLASTGFTSENLITPTNASSLKLAAGWPVQGGGTISTQPVVANNLVYWGSWDGNEHATPVPGGSGSGWATNLGQTSSADCNPPVVGVASTGAIASVTLAGQTSPRSVLFVGGGGNNSAGGGTAQLYALDALTGSVLWHTPLGSSPSTFMWSSPAVYTYTSSGVSVTSVYVGVSSFGDCPLVQGQVVQVNAATGQVQHTFQVVPNGCTGGSVWASPTVDQADGSVYVTTGNAGNCPSAEPYAVALLKLRASDLSLLSYWQVPTTEQAPGGDSDFGAAPTLFSGTVTQGGAVRSLVGVPNKNGLYYVFDRSAISTGPVARLRAAVTGDCPECDEGSISPSAWDGTTLYIAGGKTTINGTAYPGSVRAWNPNSLSAPLWQAGLPDGPVLGAVAAAPGLVAVGEGSYTVVLSASDGSVLLRAPVKSVGSTNAAIFYGPPSISRGTLFEGDTDGNLYAYQVKATQTISFTSTPPSPALFGGSYTPSATGGGSGNPVVFNIDPASTAGACWILGGKISFTGIGTCVVDANQAGSSNYLDAPQKQQSFTIGFTKTLSGNNGGSLTVLAGQAVYLSPGTSIGGSVTIQAGGALWAQGAKISGAIYATGANAIRVCASTVTSSLSGTITKTSGLIVIGDDDGAVGCGGNKISGLVKLSGNFGGVEFDGNAVSGSLTITGNTGTLPPPDTGTVDATGNKTSGTPTIQP
jgi:outer membrane protein assembly factor BamB